MTVIPSLAPDLAAHRPVTGDVLEKTPLERYVPPAKPSLVGLSREALAQGLGAIGVPERQVNMRVSQIWHWLYVRGAQDFEAMSSVSKELRALLAAHFTLARPQIAAEQTSVPRGDFEINAPTPWRRTLHECDDGWKSVKMCDVDGDRTD